ncbi:MAG: hypothetical protein KAT65_27570 [Methanophagales archaeon]|nr:hypothetical protein [Methanophagales archaeon]
MKNKFTKITMSEKSPHSKKAGAIIRIIFYILCLDGKTGDYFDSTYISNRYNELLKQSIHSNIIKNIIKKYKKHSGKNNIKTLEEKLLLEQWLNKHKNIKPIFWFDKSNNKFKLKAEYIEYLNNLMKEFICPAGCEHREHSS